MGYQTNLHRIKIVSDALGNLKDHFVFVGGATVSANLYFDLLKFLKP